MVDKEILQIKTCELYDLLSVKCVDILLAHKLISLVHDIIWYRYWLNRVVTSEARNATRCSLEGAREELDKTLSSMNLCDLDEKLVRWIANNSEYEKR